jgi:hypothetical protein
MSIHFNPHSNLPLSASVAHPGCESSGDQMMREMDAHLTPEQRERIAARIYADIDALSDFGDALEETADLAEWERELWLKERSLRRWSVQLWAFTALCVALWAVLLVTARALGAGA